jgi:Fe2+ or Zn2+ uptake regulation protein
MAIAGYVLNTEEHPSAEHVWRKVREKIPVVSRATVYNTLNLLVKKGLLRNFHLPEGGNVFDPEVDRHHHLVDEESGEIRNIQWEALKVDGLDSLRDFEITEYTVFVRGRRRSGDE